MTTQTAHTLSLPSLEAQLEQKLREFDAWAGYADQSEPGWQSDWQEGWLDLMSLAQQAIAQEALSPRALALVGQCWNISDESQWCADAVREHLQNPHTRRHVLALTQDAHVETRWQACDVLGDLPAEDAEARAALYTAIDDENPYVRRRAFLALLRHPDANTSGLIARVLADADSYNRYVAIKEGQRRALTTLHEQIKQTAQDPEVALLLAYYASHKKTIDQFDRV